MYVSLSLLASRRGWLGRVHHGADSQRPAPLDSLVIYELICSEFDGACGSGRFSCERVRSNGVKPGRDCACMFDCFSRGHE
jgi:hypothetical protein